MLIILVLLWYAARPFLLMYRLMSGSILPSFLRLSRAFALGTLAGGLGVGWIARRRARKVVWLWDLDVGGSRRAVRVALPEGHGRDIRDGDEVQIWGTRRRNGTIRTQAVLNKRTAEQFAPQFVRPISWALATAGVLILVGVLTASTTTQKPGTQFFPDDFGSQTPTTKPVDEMHPVEPSGREADKAKGDNDGKR